MFFKNWQIAILLVLGIHIFASSQAFGASDMKERLSKFRTKYNCALQEFEQVFYQHHFDEVCIAKGGIGAISRNVYVETQKGRNVVGLGTLKYVGKEGSNKQLIFISGTKILSPEEAKDSRNLIVIAFLPTHIAFYLENEDREGRYLRR